MNTRGTDSSVSCSKRLENIKLSPETIGPLGNHSFGKGKKSPLINFAKE